MAQAKGVALTREIALAEYDRFLHKLEDDATSSLQRDLHPADGAPPRESERDTFSGYLVREAHRLGISVPLSERYDQMLRNMRPSLFKKARCPDETATVCVFLLAALFFALP